MQTGADTATIRKEFTFPQVNGLEILSLSACYWSRLAGRLRQYDANHLETPIQFRRLAEQVADELRRRILRGELADGSILPKEDELLLQFPVSKPSLREAMRILEAEGLLRVRRGKLGGAVVRRPNAANVAYTVGLVLGSQEVGLSDVGNALLQVEPACAALCAARRDLSRWHDGRFLSLRHGLHRPGRDTHHQ